MNVPLYILTIKDGPETLFVTAIQHRDQISGEVLRCVGLTPITHVEVNHWVPGWLEWVHQEYFQWPEPTPRV